MKAKPMKCDGDNKVWSPCQPAEATHLRIQMPGPIGYLMLPVMIGGTREGTPNWTWNGSVEAPTLKPSIKTTTTRPVANPIEGKPDMEEVICHSWLNDGMVQFLDDTTHELRGKTVPLEDFED